MSAKREPLIASDPIPTFDDLEDQLTAALAARDAADVTVFSKVELVVNGVRADPTEGPDSALYEAMAYTRKSDRKSGLTRKKETAPPAI